MPSRYRADTPSWFESVIEKAVALNPRDRYADVMALSYELEPGLEHGLDLDKTRSSLYEKNPVAVWQFISAILFIALLIALMV